MNTLKFLLKLIVAGAALAVGYWVFDIVVFLASIEETVWAAALGVVGLGCVAAAMAPAFMAMASLVFSGFLWLGKLLAKARARCARKRLEAWLGRLMAEARACRAGKRLEVWLGGLLAAARARRARKRLEAKAQRSAYATQVEGMPGDVPSVRAPSAATNGLWYWLDEDRVSGPIDFATLQNWYASGMIRKDTPLLQEGAQQWVMAATVLEREAPYDDGGEPLGEAWEDLIAALALEYGSGEAIGPQSAKGGGEPITQASAIESSFTFPLPIPDLPEDAPGKSEN
jgi:hypothetical protein